MKIGAHLSISGGYTNPLRKIGEIGGNCLQIFSSSPRNWGIQLPPEEEIEEFKQLKQELQIDPIYFHASYLINLANPGRGGKASVETLIQELQLALAMDVKGTIIHLGSFNGEGNTYEVLLKNIAQVLEAVQNDRYFIIENAGNKKIGLTIEEIGKIMSDLKDPRIRVCLDTCHMHGGGYDISTPEKFQDFFGKFDKLIGLKNLEVFQVNDSKDELGSFRDRHENIGEGQIPPETFRLLLDQPETKDLPYILETPGFDKKGPDKENIDRLKTFASA